LEALIQDKVLRGKIAEAGYQKIMSMPTWEEQAEGFEKILENYSNR